VAEVIIQSIEILGGEKILKTAVERKRGGNIEFLNTPRDEKKKGKSAGDQSEPGGGSLMREESLRSGRESHNGEKQERPRPQETGSIAYIYEEMG